jgi:hypothetical protein
METIIFEFLLGVFAGTIFGLLIVKRPGNGTRPRKARGIRLQSSVRRATSKSKSRKVRLTRLRAKPSRVEKLQAETATKTFLTTENRTSVQSCPTCGLEAPENLMTEHFIGSPSHRYKPAKLQPIAACSEPLNGRTSSSMAEDSRDSVRSLLQMLVPPRAFGHRHRQRTVDPLSNVVQTAGSSQRSSGQ